MDLFLDKYQDFDKRVVMTANAECPRCKPQTEKGRNSLIIFECTALTPRSYKLKMGCIVCGTKVSTIRERK